MVNSSEHGLARVVHHRDYYLRGGDMTVLVDNHLYRIHSHFFERESLFFRQKFQSAEGEERGSSDNNAYTLDDVKSEDFARFLWVFYNPKYSLYDAPLETWLSILHLANRWGFANVKELTVRELEKMEIEPVEKIAIYHEYTINKLFLISSYIAVCKRDKPLSFAEGMRLGMETVLRIADARERARQRAAESGIRTPTFDDFEDNEMENMIREVFGIMSRPTSPTPQTSPSFSYSNGSTHTGSTKVNGSTAPKVNGSTAPKVNGTSSARTTGTSNPDPAARASVDTIRTFATAMESQPNSSASSNSTLAPLSNAESHKSATQAPENKATPPVPEKLNGTSPEQTSATFNMTAFNTTPTATGAPKSLWDRVNGMGEPSSVASPVLILF
ncbi:hypothetical protein K503DRAFT_687947 [Rhizopogon vinicolor AM-OR11-026]|uniref:BTB domain-containing protein n=1 Tax=Rhizopogon vinicolor AM-OR11-026 TaxID=1314800 RepID=A0A1B7N5U8_9AGAM|nr:hypothetical protein K503DRAFT_687947 [Rhizopogon vinicolor AM-OR11-026]